MTFLADLALSVIPGLFKKKQKAPGIDYVKLRDDALKAGFNPLTALMAGGGNGYQREFSPDLSSGQFIAEAVARGIDTAFNAPVQFDSAAQQIRARNADRDRLQTLTQSRLPGGFGYDLTDVQVPSPHVARTKPALSGAADEPAYVPGSKIRVQDGRGKWVMLDASIAERLDIIEGGRLMAGDYEEISGDAAGELISLGEAGIHLFGGDAPYAPALPPGTAVPLLSNEWKKAMKPRPKSKLPGLSLNWYADQF